MNTTEIPREKPEWLSSSSIIVASLDARPMLQSGQHPLALVLEMAASLQASDIMELITPFKPEPLIGKVCDLGFLYYCETISGNEIHTYFFKS